MLFKEICDGFHDRSRMDSEKGVILVWEVSVFDSGDLPGLAQSLNVEERVVAKRVVTDRDDERGRNACERRREQRRDLRALQQRQPLSLQFYISCNLSNNELIDAKE